MKPGGAVAKPGTSSCFVGKSHRKVHHEPRLRQIRHVRHSRTSGRDGRCARLTGIQRGMPRTSVHCLAGTTIETSTARATCSASSTRGRGGRWPSALLLLSHCLVVRAGPLCCSTTTEPVAQ